MKNIRHRVFGLGGSGHRDLRAFSVLSCVVVLLVQLPVSRSWEVFVNDGPLYNLVITGVSDVIIGGENVILQFQNESLSADSLVRSVNTSSVNSDIQESPSVIPALFQLQTFSDSSYLIFCGSDINSPCCLHNLTDISQFWPIVNGGQATNFVSGRPSVMVQTRSSNLYKRYYMYFLVAVPPENNGKSSGYTFSMRKLDFSKFIANRLLQLDYEKSHITYLYAQPNVCFNFNIGFESDDNTYILRNTVTENGNTAYISQSCKTDPYFRSYIEASLECNGYKDLIAASVFNTSSRGQILIASFRQTKGLIENSPLCLYWMTSIESFFQNVHTNCFKGLSGSTPTWVKNANDSCQVDIVSDCIELKACVRNC